MFIMFLIRSLDYGGAERQLVELARRLHERNVVVLVTTFYAGGLLLPALMGAGVPVSSLDKRDRWDNIAIIWRLLKLIRKHKPDVLHSYMGTSNLLAIICKVFFPQLRIVWGVRASNMDLSQYGWLSSVSYWFERRLMRFPNLIISNSRAAVDYLAKQGVSTSKMVVIPNGIDVAWFHPDPMLRMERRQNWSITEDEILIGMVARIDPMKGYPIFLKAAAQLLETRYPVRFVCIGSGPDHYQEELKTLTGSLGITGHVIWAGAQQDMPAVYNALDIHVSASIFGEGFSNAVAEAMACGVPCVATDVGDSALLIGQTGYVVAPADSQALCDSLAKMITAVSSSRSELSRRALERIQQEFDPDQLATQTLAALQTL